MDLPTLITGGSPMHGSVEVRNALTFNLYGTATGAPTHRLVIRLRTWRASVIVDVNTSLPAIENYGINATTNCARSRPKVLVPGRPSRACPMTFRGGTALRPRPRLA